MVVDGDYVGEIVATSLLGLRLVFVMLLWQMTVHSQSITSIPPTQDTHCNEVSKPLCVLFCYVYMPVC